ncbi:cytochrome-c peroxidase [Moraxella macacae]|nr:cytochrome c peroxidase [Moraxella macacae]
MQNAEPKLFTILTSISLVLIFLLLVNKSLAQNQTLVKQNDKEQLGEQLFNDKRLSKNQTMSCSTCHDPALGFADGRTTAAKKVVSLGDDGHSFGNRNTPTASYAKFSPLFHFDDKNGVFVGGQFWDGRAADLTSQASQPPLNPLEMGSDKALIVKRLQADSNYNAAFKRLYGNDIWHNTDAAYHAMTDAIAAFEKTAVFAPFDSKYDRYLKGEYELTPLEDLGRTLFFSNNNVNCHTCHKLTTSKEDDKFEVFSNHQFHNIGVPQNPNLLALGQVEADFVDTGLLAHPDINDLAQKGKFKTPTLRNVAVTAPYMHNGVFKDLRTVVLFYDKYNNPDNTINPETGEPWAGPEVADNISLDELKAQKLTDRKVDALVAFMKTLTDKRYEHLLEQEN